MPRSALFLLLPVISGVMSPARGQTGPDSSMSSVRSSVDNLVRMHEAWGPQASTPNTSLAIKEFTRSGQVIKLRLIATGIPKDAVYSLLTWPATQKVPSEALKGVTVDASGLAVCAGRVGTCGTIDNPDDPIDLVVQPAPGEPVRFGLVSSDGTTKVFAKSVPIPVLGENRGCSVEAITLTPGSEVVLIVGSGFSPNSDVVVDSATQGERHGGKGKTDAEGRYVSSILPYKQGVPRGTTKVDLKAAQCAPSVEFQWGRRN